MLQDIIQAAFEQADLFVDFKVHGLSVGFGFAAAGEAVEPGLRWIQSFDQPFDEAVARGPGSPGEETDANLEAFGMIQAGHEDG